MNDKQELAPPHSIEAEQALLGALFLDPEYCPYVREILRGPMDFYRRAHQLIYAEIVAAYDEGGADYVDWLQIGRRLEKSDSYEAAGGDNYLEEITTGTPIAHGAEQYAQIVHDKAILRLVIGASTQIRAVAYDLTVDVPKLLQDVQAFADDLSGLSITEMPNMERLYEELEKQARDAMELGIVPGWETGHPDLQELMLGWHSGGVSALAAPTGGGKTFFAFELLFLFLKRNVDLKAAFITMEMSPFEVGSRQIVGDKFLSRATIKADGLEADYAKVKKNIDAFRALGRMQIAKPKSDSIESVKSLIRSLAQRGYKFIVWDYIGLADFEGRSDLESVGKQLPKIKNMAERYGIHLLILSQMNKRSQEDSPVKFELQSLYGITGTALSNTAHNIFNCFQLHTQSDDPICSEICRELLALELDYDPSDWFATPGEDRERNLWPKELLDRLVIQKVVKGRRGSRRFWCFWITEPNNRMTPLYLGQSPLNDKRLTALRTALTKKRTFSRKK